MKNLNLMLHCGANAVDRDEVLSASTPEPTKTWFPIPHRNLIEMMTERLPSYGLEVVNESHGLSHEGNRYFGLFQVAGSDGANLDDDYGLVFGLRNSHDKTFPAGLCLGNGVFVCDNLCFDAEIVIGRKHTRFIERDLPNLVSNAMGKLVQARVDQRKRLETYKETNLSDAKAHHLIIEGLRSGAINTTRVPKVVDQWHKPEHEEFGDKNIWRLFNAFTEVYKTVNLAELPKRSEKLHGVLDHHCGLAS